MPMLSGKTKHIFVAVIISLVACFSVNKILFLFKLSKFSLASKMEQRRNPEFLINNYTKNKRLFRLVENDIPIVVVRFRTYLCLFAALSYLLAIGLGFINWRYSLAIFVIIPILYILPVLQRFWMCIASR